MANVREMFERVEPAVTMSYRQLGLIAAIGAGVGLAAWLLGMLLDMALFRFLFCRDAGIEGCAASGVYGNAAGMLIAAGLGVWALVRIQIFRPLLIGLAAALTMWGALDTMGDQAWYISVTISIALFSIAYMLFAWIMRLRSLIWAAVISIALLIVVRLVLNS